MYEERSSFLENLGLGLIVLVILIVIVVVPFYLMFAIRLSGERGGYHSGYVTAVDQDGLIYPNYQVYVKTDNSSSQEDIYCINRNNPTLANQLKELSKSREQVTLYYEGVRGFGMDLCRGEEIKEVKRK